MKNSWRVYNQEKKEMKYFDNSIDASTYASSIGLDPYFEVSNTAESIEASIKAAIARLNDVLNNHVDCLVEFPVENDNFLKLVSSIPTKNIVAW